MKHRALMIGAGGMAELWLNWFLVELAARCDVVAMVDVDGDVLKRQGSVRGLWPDRCYTDMHDAFDAVRAGDLAADCAFVVIPPGFHREAIVGAVSAGLHVLTEKPLASTWEDCLAIARATPSAKVGVIQNYRHNPAIEHARRLVHERALGQPYLVTAQFRVDYRTLGSWDRPERHLTRHPVLAEAAIHHLDQIRYLTGLEFEAVVGDEWRPGTGHDFADGPCVALLARLNDGVRATYEASAICASGQLDWTHERYRIECARGALVVDGERLVREHQTTDGLRRETVELAPMPQRFHIKAVADYLDWLDGDEYRGSTVADNLHSMRALLAAIRAVESGGWISVNDLEWESS